MTEIVQATPSASPATTITSEPTQTPVPPTSPPAMLTPSPQAASADLLFDISQDATLILYTEMQDGNWALKAYPDSLAFTETVFDTFYGSVACMEDVRQYTSFNFEPQLSPNGRYLLLPGVGGYSGPGSGAPADAENVGLWFVNLQTEAVRQLLPRAKAFTWSPSGDQITYVDGDTLYTLSMAEGAKPRPLFSHPDLWDLYAHWSPDGSTIATITTALGKRDENDYSEITDTYWLVDANNGEATAIATRPGFAIEHMAEEMSWSPTGRYLMVRNLVVREANGEEDIITSVDWMTHHGLGDDQIAYSHNSTVYLHDLRSGERRALAQVPSHEFHGQHFRVSPNGEHLAYADLDNRLWVKDVSSGEQQTIGWEVSDLGWGSGLAWRDDGQQLLFTTHNRTTLPDQQELWLWDTVSGETHLLVRAGSGFLGSHAENPVSLSQACWVDEETVLFAANDYRESIHLLAARTDGSGVWDVMPAYVELHIVSTAMWRPIRRERPLRFMRSPRERIQNFLSCV
ncbi:MAG: hypothetical protein R6X34_30405 [Chloroflexota bacterium]